MIFGWPPLQLLLGPCAESETGEKNQQLSVGTFHTGLRQTSSSRNCCSIVRGLEAASGGVRLSSGNSSSRRRKRLRPHYAQIRESVSEHNHFKQTGCRCATEADSSCLDHVKSLAWLTLGLGDLHHSGRFACPPKHVEINQSMCFGSQRSCLPRPQYRRTEGQIYAER